MKICKNCGNQIDDDKFFCNRCGVKVDGVPNPFAKLKEDPEAEEPAGAAPKKKKANKGLIIGISAAAAAAVGAGVVFGFPALKGIFGNKHPNYENMSPNERFAAAINKKVETNVDSYFSAYGELIDFSGGKKTVDSEISIAADDEFDQLILSLADRDNPYLKDVLDWIDEIGLSPSIVVDGDLLQNSLNLSANGNELAGAVVTADRGAEKAYIELPEISDTALDFSITDKRIAPFTPDRSYLNIQKLRSFIIGYTETVTGEIRNVSEGKETLDTGSFSKEYTTLTATIDTETTQNISRALLTKLRSDDDTKDMLFGSLYSAGTSEDDVNNMIDNAISNISSVNLDKELYITIYVDKDNNIAGIKFSYDKVSMLYADIEDGGKFYSALYMSVPGSSSDIKIMSGEGTVSNGRRTGSYSVEVSGMKMLEIAVEDYDLANGKKTIQPTLMASTVASQYLGMDISGMKIEITRECSGSSARSDIAFKESGKTVFEMDSSVTAKNDADIKIPTKTLSAKSKIEEWYKTLDYELIISRLAKSGMPSYLIHTLIPASLISETGVADIGKARESLTPEDISNLKKELEAKGISTEDLDIDKIDADKAKELLEQSDISVDEILDLIKQ